MASSSNVGTPGAAYSYSYSSRRGSSYATVANHHLTMQRSMPSAFFAPCGGGRKWPRTTSLGDGGGESAHGSVVGAVARAL
jgi:hypothetical protein